MAIVKRFRMDATTLARSAAELHAGGHLREAEAQYLAALEASPKGRGASIATVRYNLGVLYLSEHRPREAREQLRLGLRAWRPGGIPRIELLFYLADALFQERRYKGRDFRKPT